MKNIKIAAAAALTGVVLTGCARLVPRPAVELPAAPPPASAAHVPVTPPPPVHVPSGTASALGVYEPGSPASFTPTQQFGQRIGKPANLALYFSGWGEPFQLPFATAARADGALPVIQIDPSGATLTAIADGKYDAYLRSYAASVHDFGTPVVIGFAHEPDGNWYPWGYNHLSPADWVAAWRHVVDVFRAASARNVIWLWTMNVASTSPYPLRDWWPGSDYVTWAGLDGYYATPDDTFDSLYSNSIAQIRGFTGDPIIIAEAAVGPGTDQMAADVTDLLQGVRADNLLGLVYFDGGGRQDWRLEDHPTALAAFRAAIQQYGPG